MSLDRAIWAICGGAAGSGKKLEKVSSCGKILKILNSQNILKIPAAPAAHARLMGILRTRVPANFLQKNF